MRCLVLLASKSAGISNGLTYESGDLDVQPGQLVLVTLRGKKEEGVVLSVDTPAPKDGEEYQLKKILAIAHPTPLLRKKQLTLLAWIATYYHCSLRQAMRVFLPSPPWFNLLPRQVTQYRPAGDADKLPRGSKQKEIVALAREQGMVTGDTLKYRLHASVATVRSLVEQGFLTESMAWADAEAPAAQPPITEPALTEVQQKAYDEMKADKRPSVLFGITGSGKTEIYARMIKDAIDAGGQAILLVPEILLTAHSIDRFESLVGRERIAVLHSKLTDAARRSEWKRIHSGGVSLVIGSRSALFAPLPDPKVIILDEEHEWTYKNEQSPRYHARETAETYCALIGAKLVLGSATPSLESWHRARANRYHLARLGERYLNRPVPSVRVIDLVETTFGALYPFSPPLLDAVKARLDRQEQSVLFLNRRGMATSLLCTQCRKAITSPESQLPYTLHRTPEGRPFLLDHVTGEALDMPAACPNCGSHSLKAIGAGTQKLEDLVASVFPQARVLRADSDTLTHPEHMRELLRKMREREADILLGTQAVVKGLDLPGVTLAAVLVADVGLSLPHFRAGERVFQLLTQLTGRSGRTIPGEVIIQTFRPDAPEIVAAANHATEKYLEDELALRRGAHYPPLSMMIRLIVTEPDAKTRAQAILSTLRKAIDAEKLAVSAHAAPTFFGGGKIWHVLLRGNDARRALKHLDRDAAMVDVDPIDTL